MGNLTILWPTPLDGATITASSEASSDFAASNLGQSQPDQAWRSTGVRETIRAVLQDEAASIDALALIATNFSKYGTISWRGADDIALLDGATYGYSALNEAEPGFTSANHAANPIIDLNFVKQSYRWGLASRPAVHRVHILPTPQSYRAWRLDLHDPGNLAGYLQVGRLYAAKKWQATINVDVGATEGYIDPSPATEMRGGTIRIDPWGKRRTMEFTIGFMEEAEMRAYAAEIERLRGASGDVLVMVDPDNTTDFQQMTIYGAMRDLRPQKNFALGLWTKSYLIEEFVP